MKDSTKKTLLFMGTIVLSVWVAQLGWQIFRLDKVGSWIRTNTGMDSIAGNAASTPTTAKV